MMYACLNAEENLESQNAGSRSLVPGAYRERSALSTLPGAVRPMVVNERSTVLTRW
jgi:hypothetical protein